MYPILVSCPIQCVCIEIYEYLAVLVYTFSVVSLAMAFVAAANRPAMECVPNICYTVWAIGPIYGLYSYSLSVAFGCLAQAIYIIAIIVLVVSLL